MISASNDMALSGSRDYGTAVVAATFAPGCEAYERAADNNGSSTFAGTAADGSGTYAMVNLAPLAAADGGNSNDNPFPLAFYQNVTNQPIFANGSQCDNQIRFFNSTLNEARAVRVNAFSNLAPMDASAGALGMFGMVIDTPFVEFNGLDCRTLKGYSGTGPGD